MCNEKRVFLGDYERIADELGSDEAPPASPSLSHPASSPRSFPLTLYDIPSVQHCR